MYNLSFPNDIVVYKIGDLVRLSSELGPRYFGIVIAVDFERVYVQWFAEKQSYGYKKNHIKYLPIEVYSV